MKTFFLHSCPPIADMEGGQWSVTCGLGSACASSWVGMWLVDEQEMVVDSSSFAGYDT